MKSMRLVLFLQLLLLLQPCASPAPMKLLPGLTYYEGPEELNGKLTFLLSHDSTITNLETSASIYEFDLPQRNLRKVTESPKGRFIASDEGNAFCVVYSSNISIPYNDKSVFVFADSIPHGRSLNLDGHAKKAVIVGEQVFFVIEHPNPSTSLLAYDIARDRKRFVKFSDASRWQYEHYERIHAPSGQTNILHFYYIGCGKRLEDGKDYRDGFYSLDILTRDMRWIAELTEDDEDAPYLQAWPKAG